MPAELHWDNNEHTIIMATFSGAITVDEFLQAFDGLADMSEQLGHMAYVIADFRTVTKMPMGILAASGSTSRRSTANIGGLAIVGSNAVLKTIISVWSKLYKQMTMVGTLEDAYDWVSKQQS